jgi:hypothetical protein
MESPATPGGLRFHAYGYLFPHQFADDLGRGLAGADNLEEEELTAKSSMRKVKRF